MLFQLNAFRIPEQLRIETCVFSLHLIVIKVPYF